MKTNNENTEVSDFIKHVYRLRLNEDEVGRRKVAKIFIMLNQWMYTDVKMGKLSYKDKCSEK